MTLCEIDTTSTLFFMPNGPGTAECVLNEIGGRRATDTPRLRLCGFPLQLVAQILLARGVFGRKDLGREVKCLVHLADLDFSTPIERGALEPFYGLFHGLDLPQPEAADEFLGLGEGPVDYGPLLPRKSYPLALRARLQPLARKHYAGLYQLLVELPHGSKHFLVFLSRQNPCFRVLVRFDYHHESHRGL